jgi:hypothetical protein
MARATLLLQRARELVRNSVTFAENNSTLLRNGAIACAISKRRVNFPRFRIAPMITNIACATIHGASSKRRVDRASTQHVCASPNHETIGNSNRSIGEAGTTGLLLRAKPREIRRPLHLAFR